MAWLAIHLREPDITVVLSGIKVLYTIPLGKHIIDHYDYFPTLVVINIRILYIEVP